MNVLMIDPDRPFCDAIGAYLTDTGMTVSTAGGLADGLRLAKRHSPDVAIVNLVLGDGSGLDAIKALAGAGRPVITVAIEASSIDRILSLELGAEDFLDKPVHPRELALRVTRLGKRNTSAARTDGPAEKLAFNKFVMDTISQTVETRDGASVPLTGGQYRLLEALVRSPGRVLDRDTLASHVHGRASMAEGRSIDVLVSKLRNSLGEQDTRQSVVRNVRGLGYMLAADVSLRSERRRFAS